jgi:hypothetical protein
MTETLADSIAVLARRVADADWFVKQSCGHFGRAEAECVVRGSTEKQHLDASRDLQQFCDVAGEIARMLRGSNG